MVVPLDAGWSDLGSWDAVWDAMEKDADGNVGARPGDVRRRGVELRAFGRDGWSRASARPISWWSKPPTRCWWPTARACRTSRGWSARIKAQHAPEADAHRKVHRPWGYYDSIDHGERFQVKRIVVKPGARLSLQMHHHRAEHWIVVRGTALVTRGEEQFLLTENESTYIPLGVTHRLENPGKVPLEIIEVQSGAYLGEDDIVRFDDNYGRCS